MSKQNKRNILVVLCIVAVLALVVYARYRQTTTPLNVNAGLPVETIYINSKPLQVEVATTDTTREQGLSNRNSLEPGHGMLFVFAPPRQVGFWMKDMRFDLDMLFAKEDGTIVKIDANVPASSYPEVFSSGMPITYVLEIPAGYAAAQGIAIGQKIVVK